MHSSSARRAITGRVSTAERGTCPICGKSMRMELLAEHADLCASKLEEGGSYGGSSGVGGGMARRTHKKRLPNQRPPAASSSSHGKRPAAAGSSRALYVNAAPAPLTSPASAEASDAHPDLYLVDSVHVEGFEFRCQSLRALDKGKRELGSAPSPVGGPQALAAAKSDAADGGGDSPRWRASAASSSSSNLLPGPVACAAPLGAPPVAHDDPLASEADDFLNAVRLAFANAPKRQEKFMDVMLGFQSGT